MGYKEKMAAMIHATVWKDEELDVEKMVELISTKTGLNSALEEVRLERSLAEKESHNKGIDPTYVCPMEEFERVRPSSFMKDPINYILKRGKV